MYGELYDLKYTILRYANVYGPRQDPKGEGGVVSIFTDKMVNGEQPAIYGDGKQTRDFIYVEDIVAANLKALNRGDNQIVNISTRTQTSVIELFKTMKDILKMDIEPIFNRERPGDIRHSYLDNSRAKEVLDWAPRYDLKSGLTRTISYYARQLGLDEVATTLEESL